MNLQRLLDTRADLWRGRSPSPGVGEGCPSGFPELDARLPGGGWPKRGLVEILVDGPGRGGLDLLLPGLARWSRGPGWLVLVGPPLRPYAPGWARAGVDLAQLLLVQVGDRRERLWALEQALRSGACSAVLGWPDPVDAAGLRRLQLAAETGGVAGFLFRPVAEAAHPSPAHLRVRVAPRGERIEVSILKCRGGWPDVSRPLVIPAETG